MKEKDKLKKKSDKKKKGELKEKKIPKSEKKKKEKKKQKEELLLQEQFVQESEEAEIEISEVPETSARMDVQNTMEESKPAMRVASKSSVNTRKRANTDIDSTKTAAAPVKAGNRASREAQALIFRALGDEMRLQILEFLEEREMCAADILKLLPIVQSTLSHHMKILCEAQLVLCRREGRWSYYVLNRPIFQEAAAQLMERSK